MTNTVYDQESADVRSFLARLPDRRAGDERALASQAGAVLDAYATRLKDRDVLASTIQPARYAMAVLIDQAAREVPALRTSAWLAAAHIDVFDRRDITIDDLHQFADTAKKEGGEFLPLSDFLEGIIFETEGQRQTRTTVSKRAARLFGLWILLFVLSLAAYAAFLDYRYHAGILNAFETRVADLPSEKSPDRLLAIARLSSEVKSASAAAPLSQLVTIANWNSATDVEQYYRDEVHATLPDALREAIGEAIATEGNNIDLYDNLRAWAILTGRTDWSSAFLTGWVEDRGAQLGISGLAEHVAFLAGPEPRLAVPDEELMDQARAFALETPEADRAFLELRRLPEMRALGSWVPAQDIPDIKEVFILRTGTSLDAGLPKVFSRGGWDFATRGGVADATRRARIEAAKLFPEPAATSLNTHQDVLGKLQTTTIGVWKSWLEDLRVRPFSDGRSAIRVSGALSRRNSALEQIVGVVWREIGGDDSTRPLANKSEIEATFGEMIEYSRSGKISELSGLFASLSVALSTIDQNEERGIDALMSLQERARSVAALRNAPPLVAQIAEDVLAQTSAVHAQVLTNPLTREWQAQIYPMCQRAIDGRYPFQQGSDVDLASFEAFFGPRGALTRFYRQFAERNLDTTGDEWRWSTEMRLQGVSPESAVFLQRAVTVSRVFYDDNGRLGSTFEIAPLADRGDAEVSLGGIAVSMQSAGQSMSWPGPSPESGMQVAFRQSGSATEFRESGLWGFLRLLDQATIRNRDEGRRQLVDLRGDGGRLFFELSFPSPLNPVAAKSLLRGLACPPVL